MSPVDYHGWTHRPKEQGGTDPIPIELLAWPWVTLENGGQTVASGGSFVPSYLSHAYWDSALVTDPTAAGDPVFDLQSVSHSGNDYWQLTLEAEGWYEFEMVHFIDDLTGWAAGEYFQQRLSQPTGVSFVLDANMGDVISEELVDGTQQYIQTRRRLWVPSSDQIYDPEVRQTSGADKTVSGHLKVWYLGGLGGSTDNADWEFAAA